MERKLETGSRIRPRGRYAVAAILVIGIGLLTLPVRHILPESIISAIGDGLWSLCAYLLLALLRPDWPAKRLFAVSLAFAWCIEFSQIYHRPWIDAIRLTIPGRLILGWTFDWNDLLWYVVGCLLGLWLDSRLRAARRSIQ